MTPERRYLLLDLAALEHAREAAEANLASIRDAKRAVLSAEDRAAEAVAAAKQRLAEFRSRHPDA